MKGEIGNIGGFKYGTAGWRSTFKYVLNTKVPTDSELMTKFTMWEILDFLKEKDRMEREKADIQQIVEELNTQKTVHVDEAVCLWCKEGTSNKVYYIIAYKQENGTQSVMAMWGPNASGGWRKFTSIHSGLSILAKFSAYEKQLKAKLKKGYKEVAGFKDTLLQQFKNGTVLDNECIDFVNALLATR